MPIGPFIRISLILNHWLKEENYFSLLMGISIDGRWTTIIEYFSRKMSPNMRSATGLGHHAKHISVCSHDQSSIKPREQNTLETVWIAQGYADSPLQQRDVTNPHTPGVSLKQVVRLTQNTTDNLDR